MAKATRKTSSSTARKTAGKSASKRAGKSAGKSTGKSAGKTAGKTAARRPAAKSNLTIWKGVVTKAWKDQEFRERLMQDPGSVLAEHGFKGQKGREYRVVADSRTTKHLILPESARSVRIKPVRGSEPDPGF
jgi:hypothetical protein